MDKTVQGAGAEALVTNVLTAVVGDDPRAARIALTRASFRELALITAWAEELGRLSKQTLADYENRERNEWREASRPMTSGEQRRLNDSLMDHLRSRRMFGDGWTDLKDIALLATAHTDAGPEEIQAWAEGRLRTLVQAGVLATEDSHPGEYRIVSVAGQANAEAVTIG